MQLRDYLDPSLIFAGLRASDKPSLLSALASRTAEQLPSIDEAELLRKLEERETQGSTAVGQGIAIPHTFLDGLEQSVCVLAQVPEGVVYDEGDETMVYFLFMLVSPPGVEMKHLRLLARISRVAGREGFTQDICRATDAEAIYQQVIKEDESHVA